MLVLLAFDTIIDPRLTDCDIDLILVSNCVLLLF